MCPDGLTECRPAAKLRTAVLTNDALENRCVPIHVLQFEKIIYILLEPSYKHVVYGTVIRNPELQIWIQEAN